MSMYNIDVPAPDEYDYHHARQDQRVAWALQQIDPGDVLATVDSEIASLADPKAHPLYGMVCWYLERQLTPLDGGAFFDRFARLVLAAINTCLDAQLARGED